MWLFQKRAKRKVKKVVNRSRIENKEATKSTKNTKNTKNKAHCSSCRSGKHELEKPIPNCWIDSQIRYFVIFVCFVAQLPTFPFHYLPVSLFDIHSSFLDSISLNLHVTLPFPEICATAQIGGVRSSLQPALFLLGRADRRLPSATISGIGLSGIGSSSIGRFRTAKAWASRVAKMWQRSCAESLETRAARSFSLDAA